MKIWVSGSIARDLIMDFPGRFRDFIDAKKIHVLNLSFAVSDLKENIGGTAANISYNLALLGERPIMTGNLGQDQIGLLKYFRKVGINISGVTISRKRTATAYIITDRDDNQITGFHAGVMNEIRSRLPAAKKGDLAIIAAENPRNVIRLAKYYAQKGINYIFDPGQQITALKDSELRLAIRGAKVLVGNDYEIGLMTPSFSPLLRGRVRGGGLTVIRTLGPKGSEILAGGKRIKIGIAKPKRVLDPTGAGDAYRAGLLKGLVLGYDLPSTNSHSFRDWVFGKKRNIKSEELVLGIRTCGQLAATVASFAVEEYGTQKHRFNLEIIANRYRRNFNDNLSF